MSDAAQNDPDETTRPRSEQLRHDQVSALVPARVAPGVFCTGAVVLEGATEFVLDFLLRLNKPQRVAARVVLPPVVVGRFVQALAENVRLYETQFGDQRLKPLASMPRQPSSAGAHPADDAVSADESAAVASEPLLAGAGVSPADSTSDRDERSSVSELYEHLKLPEELLSGQYANAVMVGHTASEFSFDFITTFFPRSAVSQRVFMAAGNVKPFLDSLTHAFTQFQRKRGLPPFSPPAPPNDDLTDSGHE